MNTNHSSSTSRVSSILFSVLLVITLFLQACIDPSPVGADLLEGDQANIAVIDTLTLIGGTEMDDSVQVYTPTVELQLDNYLIGRYEHPIFGRFESFFYGQLRIATQTAPAFNEGTLDSVILVLQPDSENLYGDTSLTHHLEVYELLETLDNTETYASNNTFEVGDTPLGANMDVKLELDTAGNLKPIRIPIDSTFGDRLFQLQEDVPEAYDSSDEFVENIKGIHIRAANDFQPGLLSFDMESSNTRLQVHYSFGDTTLLYQFGFSFASAKVSTFESDFTSSPVETAFDDPAIGQDFMYIQGASGPMARIEIPYVDNLPPLIVNSATLEVTVAEEGMNEAPETYAIRQLIVGERNEEGQLFTVSDVILGGLNSGGRPEEVDENGNILLRYEFNLSSHMQEVLQGDADNSLFLRAFPKSETAAHTVIYGPNHPDYPAKLRLKVTKIDE